VRYFISLSILVLLFTGCSNTWSGVKTDAGDAANWTKEKINQGAAYIKEKTK
jgi:predicted small secreted protein